MEINTDVWGLPSSWATGASPYDLMDLKIGATGLRNLRQFWENGRLQLNTIDLSPMYYGIGKDSLLNKIYYIAPYISDGETQLSIEKLQEEDTDKSLIWSRTAPANNQTQYNWRWAEGRSDNVPTNASAYSSTFALEYSYQKMILVPYVKYHTTGTNSASTTLYSYITNQTYLTYPKIISIGYKARLGDGNGADRTLTTGLCPIINVDVPGKNLRYNGVEWYSHTGMKILQNAVGESDIVQFRQNSDLFVYVSKNNTVGDSITALAYKYCTTGNIYTYLYDPEQPFFKINKVATSSGTEWWFVYPYIECTTENANDVRDYILKQIAFLGAPFVYDPDKGKRGQIGDEGVYLPKFDINGITTGEYEEGTAALALPNAEWTDARTGSGYDPTRRPDNDDYGYLINPFNSNRFTTGLNVWCMYQQDILDVLAGINNLYLTDPTGNEKWQLDFKGSNPDDYIVSCKAMLLDVAHTDTTSAFKLGPVQFDGIACYKYNGTGSFSFGTIPLDGTGDYTPYGDFRDYQPYTTMELYIPLCGTVEIDPEFFVGHNIEIIMMYDIYTGACTAGIYRDNFTLWKAVNGQIGADIPVSAMQMGTYQNAIHSLQAAQKQNEIRLASSAVTVAAGAAALIAAPATGGTSLIAGAGLISGAAGLLSGVMQEQNYDYQIEHTQPIPAQTTAAETQNNFCVGGLYPILYVKRAKMLQGYDAEIYSHTIGNACLINGQVGSQTGLVMCSSVDLSGVPATVEEINAIKQALGKGVYV